MSDHYTCVNCSCGYHTQQEYKAHYKSEHHRYNVKRKLIGLLPLSLEDYLNQFDSEISSKSSEQKDLHCELCSKSFLSANTYKHHMKSQKHHKNRKRIMEKPSDTLSKSSSESDFSVLGLEKVKKCMFCNEWETKTHLKDKHNYPPFADECVDVNELSNYVERKVKVQYKCVFCDQVFGNEESAKQHMTDLGHAKLDINHFYQYEKFYLWKILETSSEDEAQFLAQDQEGAANKTTNEMNEEFEDLGHPTLEMLERRRLERIKLTNTGAVINGKEVGYRHLRQYYKQYVGRDYPDHKPDPNQKCLQNGPEEWRLSKRQVAGPLSCNTSVGKGR